MGGAADVFGPGGGNGAEPPAVDVKSLHAKIGELTLENDFLEGALTKAGLLSAKRRSTGRTICRSPSKRKL
jgi:transposase